MIVLVEIDAFRLAQMENDHPLRLAAAAIAAALPEAWVELHRDGTVVATVRPPRWAPLLCGAWGYLTRREMTARARRMSVQIVGFCPEVVIRW